MKFFDSHVHAEKLEDTVATAKKLGFSGLCLVTNWTDEKDLASFRQKAESFRKDLDISVGVEIKDKPQNIIKIVDKVKNLAEMILVHGGDLEVNRVAVETPEIDVLLHPELGREDSGFDHTMAKLAKKNDVAVEFGFNDLIYTYKLTRVRVLHNMINNAKLARKFNAPFVLASGAFNQWNLIPPSGLISFGRILGFQQPEIIMALSDFIIRKNRKRLSGKWVMPGVEVI